MINISFLVGIPEQALGTKGPAREWATPTQQGKDREVSKAFQAERGPLKEQRREVSKNERSQGLTHSCWGKIGGESGETEMRGHQ